MGTVIPFLRPTEPAYVMENGRYIITFPAAPVWELCAHARAAASFEYSGDVDEREPVLHLVATNSLGVYLVSPGPPGLSLTVHANGFSPKDRGWLKNKIQVYGPDEELTELSVEAVNQGLAATWKTFEIGIGEDNIVVLVPRSERV